jgi:hypothetical protein
MSTVGSAVQKSEEGSRGATIPLTTSVIAERLPVSEICGPVTRTFEPGWSPNCLAVCADTSTGSCDRAAVAVG